MEKIKILIDKYFKTHSLNDTSITHNEEIITYVYQIIKMLNNGELRVAEKKQNKWVTHKWIKQAILLYFKIQKNFLMQHDHSNYYDKIPLKFNKFTYDDFQKIGCRIVPPATIRYGAYLGNNSIVMPSFINIGAYITQGTMIDTWSTIGSCAQIGKNVHISGGVGIGGVLEPIQNTPTIIEDNCFIGARSEIVEGVIIEKGSVISMGVFIGQSTKIYDRTNGLIYYGRVPKYSVVVPGTLPSQDGRYNLYCVIIVKKVNAKTLSKIQINEILRCNS
ncbi:2,3,4,5-tetrahydropyridine-2,6-dicarboxylate N-succinyltransferase [Enterobacteriaceae endosymbiont of Macroplea appendiculata]|uniref:2,3,4,5-tetrahydropyridine-2,6-dicarboxylate N-succinyltransferase n=1 Tax=Enterobacteriaceae endosymbiont of Macroplea appendiculata TaxID=2675790 RepID=UPI0014498E76|nr:2,3,4,5-tetrahydropyridine-2,6-dicarboxylate N-succinyltransferase [Enterobacteriaceae endosymbiont of Macroplea appendiculata]QJC30663.1 2,3,4,5-tetrahydropyridine-2,6-dicarboxylate N-succinyltransferase [Enterobacteriaceae endosymbiont of Macroplea appendiculata]